MKRIKTIWKLLKTIWLVLLILFFVTFDMFTFRLSDLLFQFLSSFGLFIVIVFFQYFVTSAEMGQRFFNRDYRNDLQNAFHKEVDFYTIIGFFISPFILLGIRLIKESIVYDTDRFMLYAYWSIFFYNLILICICPYFIADDFRERRK